MLEKDRGHGIYVASLEQRQFCKTLSADTLLSGMTQNMSSF